MTDWKPKNIEEALRDAIGSAIQQYSEFTEDRQGNCGPEFIPEGRYSDVEDQTIKNISNIKGLEIKYEKQ